VLYNSYTNQILSYHNRRPFKVFEMICGTDDDDLDDLMYMRDLAQAHDDDDAESVLFISSLLRSHHRSSSLFRKRWDCEYLRGLARDEGSFLAEYRVDPRGFDILHEILDASISRDEKYSAIAMSKNGSSHIKSASRLGATLIMLGGGRRLESMRTHGLSMSTTYDNFHRVIRAINSHPALEIRCDNSESGLQSRGEGFMERSSYDIFQYCTGAIDGLAIHIRCPSRLEVVNQARFYSSNKKKYYLNMQGVCDSQCRFIAVTCKHVGSTNDAVAFSQCSLKALCEEQIYPYHWNGDNAYTSSESMMVPYPGTNLSVTHPTREWFNFWHSQVRITIERSFGKFVQHWGIFWQPLKFNLQNCTEIVHACCRLHNFCINLNLPILSSHHNTDPVALTDDNGRLADDTWRLNAQPTDDWSNINTSSTL
jgi:DDE superfamily endonuclease